MRGGRSRNKVAVGEPAAGSPPNYQNSEQGIISLSTFLPYNNFRRITNTEITT